MSRRLTTDDTTIALGDHGDLAGGVACGAGLEGYRAGVSTSQGGVLSVDEFVHVREDDLHLGEPSASLFCICGLVQIERQ